jgi:hypothetical protein
MNKRKTRGHLLTDEEKKSNRKLSKVYIKVEHTLLCHPAYDVKSKKTFFRRRGFPT